MTDTSTVLKNSYQGNGSATEFAYQFKILDENEIEVIRTNGDGTTTTLELNTDFSVSGVGNNTGGSITYPISGSPLPTGQSLTLYPVYALTQTLDFTNQDKAYFQLFEEGLDRANLKIKMLKEELDRSVKLPVTSSETPDNYLSLAEAYAGQANTSKTQAESFANAASEDAQAAEDILNSLSLPSIATGDAGKILTVKSDESGYEFLSDLKKGTFGAINTLSYGNGGGSVVAKLQFQIDSAHISALAGRCIRFNNETSDAFYPIDFLVNGSQKGFIQVSGTGTTYSTTSDYRLKENITPLTNALSRLQALPVYQFSFINDGDNRIVDGFLAHEVSAVVPEAVIGQKDAEDADGNIIPQGVDQSKIVPLLVRCVQELIARIEALEAQYA